MSRQRQSQDFFDSLESHFDTLKNHYDSLKAHKWIVMVKCNLSILMGNKRLKIADVVRDTGINRSTLTRLYHEQTTRIDFETLEVLCRYLDCTPNDLLELENK